MGSMSKDGVGGSTSKVLDTSDTFGSGKALHCRSLRGDSARARQSEEAANLSDTVHI
jgi:hypothetical protein